MSSMKRHEIKVFDNTVFYTTLRNTTHIITKDISPYYMVESGCIPLISAVGGAMHGINRFQRLERRLKIE